MRLQRPRPVGQRRHPSIINNRRTAGEIRIQQDPLFQRLHGAAVSFGILRFTRLGRFGRLARGHRLTRSGCAAAQPWGNRAFGTKPDQS